MTLVTLVYCSLLFVTLISLYHQHPSISPMFISPVFSLHSFGCRLALCFMLSALLLSNSPTLLLSCSLLSDISFFSSFPLFLVCIIF